MFIRGQGLRESELEARSVEVRAHDATHRAKNLNREDIITRQKSDNTISLENNLVLSFSGTQSNTYNILQRHHYILQQSDGMKSAVPVLPWAV